MSNSIVAEAAWPITADEVGNVAELILTEQPGKWFTAEELVRAIRQREIVLRNPLGQPILAAELTMYFTKPKPHWKIRPELGLTKIGDQWHLMIRHWKPPTAESTESKPPRSE